MDAVYQGVARNFSKDETGIPAIKTDVDLIGESIWQILSTNKGERVMRPNYGVNLYGYLFENDFIFTTGRIQQELVAAIRENEPRANVTPGDITLEKKDQEVVITVEYKTMNQIGTITKTIKTG